MIIRSVSLDHACGLPDSHEMTLPERGLVVVTGPNGAGKTSLCIDAATAAAWGETTRSARSDAKRGVPPWGSDGSDGSLTLTASVGGTTLAIERRRERGKVALRYSPGGEDYDTATKAQPGLERILGPFIVWRRTRVFSSTDAVRLSMAAMTDGELKKLVESLLCVNFDGALEACRKDLRTAERAAQTTEVDLGRREARVRAAQGAVTETGREAVDMPAPPTVDPGLTTRLTKRITASQACLDDAQEELTALREKRAGIQTRRTGLHEHATLLEKDACPVCERPITKQDRTKYAAPIRASIDDLQASETQLVAEVAAKLAEIREQQADISDLHEALRAATAAAQQAESARAERGRAAQRTAQAALELSDAERELSEATTAHAKTTLRAQTLAAVADVLGLKGPRTMIVQHALDSVEATANKWLERLFKPRVVSIRLTSGDAMAVEGIGGGYGYAACSTGQRRRIDFALWLGFGSLAPQHRGGTMLLDEPFDGLDSVGRAAVVDAVQVLAAEQCVVLIAHDQDLLRALEGKSAKKVVMEEAA